MWTKINKNERSWAIDMISDINAVASANDLEIKRVGGEATVRSDGITMFPDLILYGDASQNTILQGWELKMPDTPIEDAAFIADAQRKAVALNLNSCFLWNFTYAVLYVRRDNGKFEILKQWTDTSYIRTRADVGKYRTEWQHLLESIIIELDNFFASGQLRSATIGEIVSTSAITALIQKNKGVVANGLRLAARAMSMVEASINRWWLDVKTEYEQDESDQYEAYAKNIILNWTNRIVFAHLIKTRQAAARVIDTLSFDDPPVKADAMFHAMSEKCDFYNIFSSMKWNTVIPDETWRDLVEFSLFMKNNNVDDLDQQALQSILESSVATSKRAMNGQYTTPPELARILVRLSVRDWREDVLDCCCGTGTIAKAAIQLKKSRLPLKQAVETVWACDKYQYPLQIANISMADADSVRIANRLFQHNALSLRIGEAIKITNPDNGEVMNLELPVFGAVVSNLPFVAGERVPDEDKAYAMETVDPTNFDSRSDLYCYIVLKIADILKPDGVLGVIISNSWMATKAGKAFIQEVKKRYYIEQVHISGAGRWFSNADVVTTMLILRKIGVERICDTQFWLWKCNLEHLEIDGEAEDQLVNSALLDEAPPECIAVKSSYADSQIEEIISLNVSYNALFHQVNWLPDIHQCAVPIGEIFHVFRGSRRGWDKLFYPQKGEHRIEKEYLYKVLKNARNTNYLTATADGEAFCCSCSIEELREKNHLGAIDWISRFEHQVNGVGKPLPQVLATNDLRWYELKANEIAEIFTMMNPDKRFFFARFDVPSFINQRLIGLRHRAEYPDLDLNHALLNSIFTMFYIEAAGFGRGLGVLDINKDNIESCYMLNPKLVSKADREKILRAFDELKARPIMSVADELRDPCRLEFEHTVLRSFGLDGFYSQIEKSLLSMQEARANVRK